MTTLVLNLDLATDLDARTRQRCPRIEFRIGNHIIERLRSDVEQPRLPIQAASIDCARIEDDCLSRVIDEQAWLAELARVTRSGGHISLTAPADGPLGWLDAHTIYRYTTDILKRGNEPDATLPTGWHRHYSGRDLRQLLTDAGYADITMSRVGIGLAEIPQLLGLGLNNFVRGRRDAELELFPFRQKHEALDQRIPVPAFGITWKLTASRTQAVPYNPAPTPPNTPAADVGTE